MSEVVGQVSNLCLSPKEILIGGVTTHQAFLEEVADLSEDRLGYDGGYEVTPTRALVAATRLTDGLHYQSVHQGWAGNNKFALPMQRSLPSLKTIERLSAGKLDAVVFGDARKNGAPVNFGDYNFASSGVQITPEVFKDWNINGNDRSSYELMVEDMAARGLGKLVVDPFHLYRAHRFDGSRISPEHVMETAKAADIAIDRVHLRAGNKDLGTPEDHNHTEQDLKALLTSPEALARSRMGGLLIAAYEIFQQQNQGSATARFAFVNEVTHGALVNYHNKRQEQNELAPEPFTRQDRANYHATMAANARALFKK